MNRQGLLTVLGVTLSLIIAFSGWMLTNLLLDRQDTELFASRGGIDISAPAGGAGTDPGIGSFIAGEKLDEEAMIKIAEILSTWNAEGTRTRPHEPVQGQLNMEQAFAAAEAGLSFLSKQGVIKEELLKGGFSKIGASLCESRPAGRRDIGLPPEYSYWSLDLSYEKVSVRLRMNAVTGAIWEIGFYPVEGGIQLTSLDEGEILDIYAQYLGLEGEDPVKVSEGIVTKGFLGNVLTATAIKTFDVARERIESISLSLTASGRLP